MGTLNFIGGEKGGVGKSVMSRVLAQYFIDKQRPFTGFDTDRSHQSLRRFYADYAHQTVIDSYESLDLIAESFVENSDRDVLIDLAAQTNAPLNQWIQDSDLFDVLDEMSIAVNFWHVMDGSKDSVNLLNQLLDTHGDKPRYIIVLNQGRSADFSIYDQSPVKERVHALGADTLTLPKLHEKTMQKIDFHNSSFWAAVNHKSNEEYSLGMLERRRVKVWLDKTYAVLDGIAF